MRMKYITGRMYRNGDTGIDVRGRTALDIVRYEQEELGNDTLALVSDDVLAGTYASHTTWLALEPNQYNGELEVYDLERALVLAMDHDGGYLVDESN